MGRFYKIIVQFLVLITITGLAFASSPRLTLVEEFTSVYSKTSGEKNPQLIKDIQSFGKDVVSLMIHCEINGAPGLDPFSQANPGLFQRVGLYISGSVTIPSLFINGVTQTFDNVVSAITSYKGKTSPYTIIIIEKKETDKTTATVVIHTDIDFKSNQVFFLGVVEKYINLPDAGDNGESEHYWVARAMAPNNNLYRAGMALALKAGQSGNIAFEIPYNPAWNKDQIEVIGFIQDLNTKEVLQAARTTTEQDVDPAITLPVSQVNFETVSLTKTMKLKIQNSGILPLQIDNLAIENDPDGVFEVITKTPIVIGYKMDGEVEVRFTPKQNRPYNSNLKITSNASNGKTKSVSLIGIGSGVDAKPDVSFSTPLLDFGKVSKETTKSFTITNTGYANLIIGEVKIENDPKNAFTLVPRNFTPLPRGQSVNVEVKFKPRKNITYFANVRVSSNAVVSKTMELQGTGENVVVENPEITVDQGTLDFGNVSTNKSLTLQITNSGQGELVIEQFNIQADQEGIFTVVSPKPPPIPLGQSATIEVNFRPSGNEEYFAFLDIVSNAVESPTKTITLMGVGDKVEDSPAISILDKEVDFGEVVTGEKFVTILNKGTGNLSISGISIMNNTDGVFELLTPTIPVIEPSKDGKITVRFTAKDNKLYTSDLYFRSNTGPGGTLVDQIVPMKAYGILSVEDLKEDKSILNIEINPNPAVSNSVINYTVGAVGVGELTINLYDNTGNLIRVLYNGTAEFGLNSLPFSIQDLSSGQYYILATYAGYKSILPVVIMK